MYRIINFYIFTQRQEYSYRINRVVFKSPSPEILKTLETAPNMYLVLSPALYILTASDLYLNATETTRDAIAGKHIFEAFPDNPDLPDADGVQNINASLQEVLKTKKPHYMRIQRYDVPDRNNPGQFIQRYWDPSHTPVFDSEGNISYIIQSAINVTDKVITEQALANHVTAREKLEISEHHFRHLADLVPAKISNAKPSGEVTYFNKQWLDYSRLSFEDLRDFGYHNMMHPDEVEEFSKRLAEAAVTRKSLEMEMRFLNADGEYRWHLNIASPILDDNGHIVMWVGSTTDIQKLKEEEKRKTDFIGMVSHELKTPLTSLNAYLQMLQRKAQKAEDDHTANALEKSVKQVKKMTNMINGFLNVSRLESAMIHIDKQPFDIKALLKEVQEDVLAGVGLHEVRFSAIAETIVLGDRDKIGQVIQNLISNAVKYSPAGTTIEVNCVTGNDIIRISVSDQGYGIKLEDQQRLFDLYYRVETRQSDNVSGFGIGLYLCAEIVKRHNGKIWVDSTPGKGSTFSFSIPL